MAIGSRGGCGNREVEVKRIKFIPGVGNYLLIKNTVYISPLKECIPRTDGCIGTYLTMIVRDFLLGT